MTRTRFDLCLDSVLAHEGGYVDHPGDPGGATNMGITRKTLARWRKVTPWWDLPKTAVRNLHREEAARIYRALCWDVTRAADLPAGLDLALFDFAVNSGPDRAIRALQALLGVKVDGRVGPLTVAAARARAGTVGVVSLIDALCDRRLGFLKSLATFATFGRGWSRRIVDIRSAARAAAGVAKTNLTASTWSTSMQFLDGYKTYIVAALMLLVGIAQALGIAMPTLDGAAPGHLIMEALAVIFLRKGLKSDISRA